MPEQSADGKANLYEQLFGDRYIDDGLEPFREPICITPWYPPRHNRSSLMSNPARSARNSIPARPEEISKEERELYDRQIRLWGLDAQNRLRNSNVLLVGLSGLGAEVAKNLMLCGLKSLTLMDEREVSQEDFGAQFLIPPNTHKHNRAAASRDRTHVLNPMVELCIIPEGIDSQREDFVRQFQLVILVDQRYETARRIDALCRQHNVMFIAGSVYGWAGFAFFDFNNQLFLLPKPKEHAVTSLDDDDDDVAEPSVKRARPSQDCKSAAAIDTITLEADEDAKIQQRVPFPSFETALNVDWTSKKARRARFKTATIPHSYAYIRALMRLHNKTDEPTIEDLFAQYKEELVQANMSGVVGELEEEDIEMLLTSQLSPVCAIVGSIIGQESIKALSQTDVPLKNLFLYSALDSTGIVCSLPPSA